MQPKGRMFWTLLFELSLISSEFLIASDLYKFISRSDQLSVFSIPPVLEFILKNA